MIAALRFLIRLYRLGVAMPLRTTDAAADAAMTVAACWG